MQWIHVNTVEMGSARTLAGKNLAANPTRQDCNGFVMEVHLHLRVCHRQPSIFGTVRAATRAPRKQEAEASEHRGVHLGHARDDCQGLASGRRPETPERQHRRRAIREVRDAHYQDRNIRHDRDRGGDVHLPQLGVRRRNVRPQRHRDLVRTRRRHHRWPDVDLHLPRPDHRGGRDPGHAHA